MPVSAHLVTVMNTIGLWRHRAPGFFARPYTPGVVASPRLQAFVEESRIERRSILAFAQQAAQETPRGSSVLDAGAGSAPYRELFGHCDYVAVDWPGSPHLDQGNVDILASLEALPLPDASFDAVLSTQVLEHVPEPATVLRELRRVLVPEGTLWLTVPFVWELHEEPHDYFRFTVHGLRHLLETTGFADIEVAPRTGFFSTLAVLTRNCPQIIGSRHDGRQLRRRVAAWRLRRLSRRLERLDGLDVRRALPLGYQCRARRPGEGRSEPPATARGHR